MQFKLLGNLLTACLLNTTRLWISDVTPITHVLLALFSLQQCRFVFVVITQAMHASILHQFTSCSSSTSNCLFTWNSLMSINFFPLMFKMTGPKTTPCITTNTALQNALCSERRLVVHHVHGQSQTPTQRGQCTNSTRSIWHQLSSWQRAQLDTTVGIESSWWDWPLECNKLPAVMGSCNILKTRTHGHAPTSHLQAGNYTERCSSNLPLIHWLLLALPQRLPGVLNRANQHQF